MLQGVTRDCTISHRTGRHELRSAVPDDNVIGVLLRGALEEVGAHVHQLHARHIPQPHQLGQLLRRVLLQLLSARCMEWAIFARGEARSHCNFPKAENDAIARIGRNPINIRTS